MAECNEPLLKFDSILLDVNENPSNAESSLIENNETVPSTEISSNCDLAFTKTLQDVDNVVNEVFPNTNDLCTNNAFSPNLAEKHVISNLITNETSQFSPFTGIKLETTDNTSDVHIDKLDAVFPDSPNNGISNRNSDSGIQNSQNNTIEDTNMIDFVGDFNFSNDCGAVISEFINMGNEVQVKDEEFHDAVQFFKDPSSFSFLENAGSLNTPAESQLTRSSLYMNFDPLHAKYFTQPAKSSELHEITEDDVEPEVTTNDLQSDAVPNVVNKHLANVSPRESIGNILISFDSPAINKESFPISNDGNKDEPCKLYTEEELQQALKIQELSVQETFLKKQQELEMARSQKQEELEGKIEKQQHLCSALHSLLKEMTDVSVSLYEEKRIALEKLETVEKENEKLKEDVKTSVEDLQSVESTFADFHKRYENCKEMLKAYTLNESNLKKLLDDAKVQLQEKDDMYKALQTRTEEMLDMANTEVTNAKKAGDSQIAVLKAQLKKAELKISSLESDVKHVRIENGKLSSICDELMTKVSES